MSDPVIESQRNSGKPRIPQHSLNVEGGEEDERGEVDGEKQWEMVRNDEKRRNSEEQWETMRNGEQVSETMRNGEKQWETVKNIEKQWETVRNGENGEKQ